MRAAASSEPPSPLREALTEAVFCVRVIRGLDEAAEQRGILSDDPRTADRATI